MQFYYLKEYYDYLGKKLSLSQNQIFNLQSDGVNLGYFKIRLFHLHSLKYLILSHWACKDVGIRIPEFVAKT